MSNDSSLANVNKNKDVVQSRSRKGEAFNGTVKAEVTQTEYTDGYYQKKSISVGGDSGVTITEETYVSK